MMASTRYVACRRLATAYGSLPTYPHLDWGTRRDMFVFQDDRCLIDLCQRVTGIDPLQKLADRNG